VHTSHFDNVLLVYIVARPVVPPSELNCDINCIFNFFSSFTEDFIDLILHSFEFMSSVRLEKNHIISHPDAKASTMLRNNQHSNKYAKPISSFSYTQQTVQARLICIYQW